MIRSSGGRRSLGAISHVRLIAAGVLVWVMVSGTWMSGHATVSTQSATAIAGTPVADATTCPVTPYAAEAIDPSFSSTWLRAGDLWAAPDVGNMGAWFAEPEWMKVQWRRPVGEKLTVEGRRLDGDAPPLVLNIPDDWDSSSYIVEPLTFPTAGCWEVVGRTPGAELRFVVFVHPGEEHYRHTPPPAIDPGIWQTLSRPLEAPVVAQDGVCPASPGRAVSRVEGTVFGDGPVAVQGLGGTDTLALNADGTLPLRWIFSPEATGPFLMRAVPLGGSYASFGATDPQPEFRFSRRLLPQTVDWQIWSLPLTAPGPGCYALQIDAPAFTQVIVLDIAA